MLEESNSDNQGYETNLFQLREQLKSSSTCSYFLELMYEESSNSMNTIIYEDFNPFKYMEHMTDLDLVRAEKSTKRYLSLKNHPFNKNNFQAKNQTSIASSHPKPMDQGLHLQCEVKSQFGITESEFLRFCDYAEMEAKKSTIATLESLHTNERSTEINVGDRCTRDKLSKFDEILTSTPSTPVNKKSIVEENLQDFCVSPNEETQSTMSPESPIFRFRSIPIRTYAGIKRRTVRRNIDKDMFNVYLSDDDGTFSDSSELSVQEDFTREVIPPLDTVDLKTSIRIRENLVYLSSHFSQASLEKTSQSSKEQMCTSAHNDTLKELLEAGDDLILKVSYDSTSYENAASKKLCNLSETIEMEKNQSVIEEPYIHTQNKEKMYNEGESGSSSIIRNGVNSLPKKLLQETPIQGENLFEGIDLWDDNEYFLNYITQMENAEQKKASDFNSSSKISKGQILMTEVAKDKAQGFLPKYKQSEREKGSADMNTFNSQTTNIKSTFLDLTTTSGTSVSKISNQYKRTKREPQIKKTISLFGKESFSKAFSVPFSYEPKAKKPKKLTDVPGEYDKISTKLHKNIDFVKEGIVATQESNPVFKCFSGTKKEEITVAKHQLDWKEEAKVGVERAYEGFKLASNKSIQISAVAKEKAEKLIKEFEAQDIGNDIFHCLEGTTSQLY